MSNWQYDSIGSDDGLAPNRRQNIVWTNDGMFCWRMYISWWRHQIETFSVLLAIFAGNSPIPEPSIMSIPLVVEHRNACFRPDLLQNLFRTKRSYRNHYFAISKEHNKCVIQRNIVWNTINNSHILLISHIKVSDFNNVPLFLSVFVPKPATQNCVSTSYLQSYWYVRWFLLFIVKYCIPRNR